MSSYSELIKSFEKIRPLMKELYIYGFKSRKEYSEKSPRSYDDERRKIESWLGDYIKFIRTPDGKNVYISIDSRQNSGDPLFNVWKSKSFTAADITLHFILLDILSSHETALSSAELIEIASNDYFSHFDSHMEPDESTVRKKLKEYCDEGMLVSTKQGRQVLYKRSEPIPLEGATEALRYFSEVLPCGVIGSFLLDRIFLYSSETEEKTTPFCFKHHYITGSLDSDIIADLFIAIRSKNAVILHNYNKSRRQTTYVEVVPLKIYVSVQSGRNYLLAYKQSSKKITSIRIDGIREIKLSGEVQNYDEYLDNLDATKPYIWGVNSFERKKETVEFTVFAAPNEKHIPRRLKREKRCGTVTSLGGGLYRFHAEVFDATELTPWIRTFICRITDISFSNKSLEQSFKRDIQEMYKMYGI